MGMNDWRDKNRVVDYVARCFLDYCGRSVQPTLLNEAFRRPLQYRFLALSLCLFAVQRFGADLVHALESHYFIPCLLSILSVLYHIAPA